MAESYQDRMKSHLAAYKEQRLGIVEQGEWRGNAYAHILPKRDEDLNILEGSRAAFRDYRKTKDLRLHRDFAHLNSSQAACFNLFLPLVSKLREEGSVPLSSLSFDPSPGRPYAFEYVPNKKEGTNFDFWCRGRDGSEHFVEFKLTESDFGAAKADEKHETKRTDTYLPLLRGKVDDEALKPSAFFRSYQLLRNVAYSNLATNAHITFLIPRANSRLTKPLEWLRAVLKEDASRFVHVVYLEDVVAELRGSPDADVAKHFAEYQEKYLPD